MDFVKDGASDLTKIGTNFGPNPSPHCLCNCSFNSARTAVPGGNVHFKDFNLYLVGKMYSEKVLQNPEF